MFSYFNQVKCVQPIFFFFFFKYGRGCELLYYHNNVAVMLLGMMVLFYILEIKLVNTRKVVKAQSRFRFFVLSIS